MHDGCHGRGKTRRAPATAAGPTRPAPGRSPLGLGGPMGGGEPLLTEGLLIAAGQNLKRYLAATGTGRGTAPCGSLVALPHPPHRPVAVLS